jgi:hypothetical protein
MNKAARKATRKGKIALILLALKKDCTLSDINAEIQDVIDDTWEAPSLELLQLFPYGKPTPALFIGTIATHITG